MLSQQNSNLSLRSALNTSHDTNAYLKNMGKFHPHGSHPSSFKCQNESDGILRLQLQVASLLTSMEFLRLLLTKPAQTTGCLDNTWISFKLSNQNDFLWTKKNEKKRCFPCLTCSNPYFCWDLYLSYISYLCSTLSPLFTTAQIWIFQSFCVFTSWGPITHVQVLSVENRFFHPTVGGPVSRLIALYL